jgi:hypothetical protein
MRAAIYYAVAFTLTWLTYQIWGHTYIHGPGLHHLIGFLALAGGAIWIVKGLVRLLLKKQDKQNLGFLIVNVVVVASVVTYFIIDIHSETVVEAPTNKADIITIHRDTIMNSSSIVDGFGDTILLKLGDSTVIGKTEEWAK